MTPSPKLPSSTSPTMQSGTDTFRDFVFDQLSNVPQFTYRKMFGGYGLYQKNQFFGILHKGRLYFNTHTSSRDKYVAHGMQPFRPNKTQTLRTYYEVPPDLLEDTDLLTIWAQEACRNSTPSRKHK